MTKFLLFLIIPLFLFSACGGAPDYDPLSLDWARYIAAHPGGHNDGTPEASRALFKAKALEKTGYNLYRSKKDRLAVPEYENALRQHASGRLYFRYANSLSNLPELEKAARAYSIALVLGYENKGVTAYNAACTLSRLGRTGEALAMVKRAVAGGYSAFRHMGTDADLKNLHKTEGWKRFYRGYRSLSRAEFRQLADAKIVEAVSGTHRFVFWTWKEFLSNGKGGYMLYSRNHQQEGGEFRMDDGRILLISGMSYMNFSRTLRIRRGDQGMLIINGQQYRTRKSRGPKDGSYGYQ